MPAKSPRVPRAERIELIRRLLIEGKPEWEIKRMIRAGHVLDDGRICKVSGRQLKDDLQAIGLQYRALHDNPLIVERVVGACVERISRIAHKAEEAGQYHAALRANQALIDIVSRRSPRWDRKGLQQLVEEPTAAELGEFERLSDAELLAEYKQRRARTAHLVALPGGKRGAS